MVVTHAVGVRTYQLFCTEKRGNSFVDPNDDKMKKNLAKFIAEFIKKKSKTTNVTAQEKNWALIEKSSGKVGNSRGLISYGRYGYAASLQDVKTGKETYKKKRDESEMINLYYQFWIPDKEKFAICAFSSFSGRSCITLIFDEMKSSFEKINPGYLLKFRKLMPSGATAKIYAGKPVKNVRLVARRPPNDLADQLFNGKSQTTRKMTISIHAGRNSILGDFTDLMNGLPPDSSGVIQYDGVEFDQAVAMIQIGDQLRSVGVFGSNADVGVVDITDVVVKDVDGLPTFQSLDKESTSILGAIYKTLNGQKR